jgi:hypothetical protein
MKILITPIVYETKSDKHLGASGWKLSKGILREDFAGI